MSAFAPVHVVIVNYRTATLTIRLVKSLLEHKIVPASGITIVENASPDDSASVLKVALPDVNIKLSHVNGGFGAGVNFGASDVKAKYILVLNPDTYFEADFVTPLLAELDQSPDIGLAGFGLINPDGSNQYGARRFYSMFDIAARRNDALGKLMARRLEKHLMVAETDVGEAFDADWVMGAGFVIRSDVFEKLRGMDESYFLYLEDVDICARVWHQGYRVTYFPQYPLVHDHQRQSAQKVLSFSGRAHLRSLALFAKRFSLPVFNPPRVSKLVASYDRKLRQG